MTTDLDNETVVRQVFADLPFPVYRWQLIAQATEYGADAVTMAKLHRLPARRYAGCKDVAATIVATQHTRQRPRVHRRRVIPMNVPRSLIVSVVADSA